MCLLTLCCIILVQHKKAGQNILDNCSGIATKTRKMVDMAKSVSPNTAILTTRNEFPGVVLLAAGGINETKITDYANTQVNGIVTTCLYSAKPIDVGVVIEKC